MRRSRISTRRKKGQNTVSFLLLVAGIAIILYTVSSQVRAAYLQRKVDADLARYAASLSAEISTPPPAPEDSESPSDPSSPSVSPGDTPKNPSVDPQGEVPTSEDLGILVIPSINLRARIVEGVGSEELVLGIGHIGGTALPGSRGNSALAGHRTSFKMHPFLDLDKVSVGDEIEVITESKAYLYEVARVVVVAPDDVSVLKQDRSKTQLTLITCHPKGDTSQRLVVQADLLR